MSRRRTRTYGDVVRDVARRRQARKQMIIDMEATRLLQLVGHAPLCADRQTQRSWGARSGIRHRLAEPGGRGRFKVYAPRPGDKR